MKWRNDKVIITGLFLIWAGVLPYELLAVDRFVVPPGTAGITSGTPYNAWTNAATNIQLAINASVSGAGETVWVSNGTYYLTNQINVNKIITLRGLNGASNTFVDGNNMTNCLYMNDNYGTVDGLTFQHGYSGTNSTAYGAGIRITKGYVSNCWVISNVAGYDAGIWMSGPCTVNLCEIKFNMAMYFASGGSGGGIGIGGGGKVINSLIQGNYAYDYSGGISFDGAGLMSNCTIIANSNTARGGGGISVGSGGIAQDCKISNNWTLSSGGGVRVSAGGLITNSIISSNYAAGVGGGAWILASATNALRNCVVSNNQSGGSGAGIAADNSGGRAYHCVIANNRAGGGIYSYDPANVFDHCQILNNSGNGVYLRWNGMLSNCVIAGNSGSGVYMETGGRMRNCLIYSNAGYGIYLSTIVTYTGFVASCTIGSNANGGVYLSGTTTRLTNTVIYGNTTDIYATGGNTNAFTYCCANFASFAPGLGNKTNNPMFRDPAGNNYRLVSGSPCVNAGTNQDWMIPPGSGTLDLDDGMRIRYGTVDMGAYEHIFSGMMFSGH